MVKRPATSSRTYVDHSPTFDPKQREAEKTCLSRLRSILFWGVFMSYTFLFLFGEQLLLPRDETKWCRAAQLGYPVIKDYPNPDANNNPCYYERTFYLLYMNQFELTFSRRMIMAVLLGAAIGFERKASDRPAGVRTMSLVCLGASFFTLCGQHAFRASTQEFDAARVSAAIPSGVGFLGSALIWKYSKGLGSAQEIHGLTTAASVWLSASVGVGAGGGLYVLSVYAVFLVIFVLRIGPRLFLADDSSSIADTETEVWDTTGDEKDVEEKPMTRAEQRQMLEEEARHNAKSNSSRRRKSLQPTYGS